MQADYVIVPVADMRAEPDHRSERVSQALFGQVLESLKSGGTFIYVRGDDGYCGWVSREYLDAGNRESEPTFAVLTRFARLETRDGGTQLLLPIGALLQPTDSLGWLRQRGTAVSWKLLDGTAGQSVAADPAAVALPLISIPYLWGGASTFGFDCSGFVQAVFRRCGVLLPRDTAEQQGIGELIKWPDSLPGDLVFFPGHVALHLGDRKIIHATRLRGTVAIESLDPAAADFRDDLAEQISCVRRLL